MSLSSPARNLRWTGLVVLTMLSLAACGGGGDAAAPDGGGDGPAGAGSEVVIEGFTFVPEEIEVAAGTTVTWTNQDSAAHTIKDEGELFPESEELAQGESFSYTYDTPGEYPYICGIHPFMTGTVTVT